MTMDLQNKYLLPFLEEKCQQYNIKPERIILEILENVDSSIAIANILQLKKLKQFGVKIAFDDFGEGYSNFSRILELDVDYIKIDGNFIRHIIADEMCLRITNVITQFSKKIGVKVIAEFVHDEATYKKIQDLHIDYAQGYHIGQPVPCLYNPTP